ncbi:MAG TPA: TIGR00159 family protein [Firmicutes bacterium]|nr:TIGR00159 family protein [Bacillota bacterium]
MPYEEYIAVFRKAIGQVSALRVVTSVADILIVAYVIYRVLVLIRGTRAVSLIKGLAVLFVANLISQVLGLTTVYWLLQRTITMVFVALPIVFLPELRRALEQIGRGRLFSGGFDLFSPENPKEVIAEISRAAGILSREKVGALLVIERNTGLSDLIEAGIKLDAIVSGELLVNIFTPNTPMHDGAVVIRGGRVAAAGCYLPLTDNPSVSRRLGTRHRAALGISEQTDAVVVIVSEETGVISIASDGRLTRYLDEDSLRERLQKTLETRPRSGLRDWLKAQVRA